MKSISIGLLAVMVLAGCSALQDKEKTNVNEIIRTQEIKQVNATDILINGEKVGKQISDQIASSISSNCSLTSIADSLSNKEFTIIFGTNSNQFGNPESQELFEAYQYAFDEQIKLEPSVQHMKSGSVLYTYPISSAALNEKCQADFSLGMFEIVLTRKYVVNAIEL